VDDDYLRLHEQGIATVRDTVRWHLIESIPGSFDFSTVEPMIRASERHHMQIVWDLCHYGWPRDLDVFSEAFIDRFAEFCRATARFVRDHSDRVPIYTPVNEISFLAWAAGEVGWFLPFGQGRGAELKRQLVRAAIAGTDAIWSVDARARVATVEPVIHVVPPRGRPEFTAAAAQYRQSQFEAFDMLTGVLEPELGGAARYLDIVGVNFYHDNQWEHPGGEKVHWHILPRDPRWVPFHHLLAEVYERYRRPIFVAETSHVGSGRAEWLRELTTELEEAVTKGVPLEGVCLYPIIDRFDWDNPEHWHNSGLWDLVREEDGRLVRLLHDEYADQLRASQRALSALGFGRAI
jgi:beta-glucosidase/6-phospho-beta-glucosidase/beta-galactosidase